MSFRTAGWIDKSASARAHAAHLQDGIFLDRDTVGNVGRLGVKAAGRQDFQVGGIELLAIAGCECPRQDRDLAGIPTFMIAFMGTTLVCLVLAGGSFFWWGRTGGMLSLAASLIYIVGCFGVTVVCNVPLNDQLAAVAPAQEAALWSRYLDVWTAWNHVRTIAPIVSAIQFTAALCLA